MNRVNEQQISCLDEMDERGAQRFLTRLLSNLDPAEENAVRRPDYLLEIPQSGERP